MNTESECQYRSEKGKCTVFRNPYHFTIPKSTEIIACELRERCSPNEDQMGSDALLCPLTLVNDRFTFVLASKAFLKLVRVGNSEEEKD